MKFPSIRLLAGTLPALVFLSASALADVRYESGIEVEAVQGAGGEAKAKVEAPQGGAPLVAPPPELMVIDFDDLPATCGWSSTPGALSDEYAEYGVTFEGPGGLDGGGVIDECGNFGVSGQSSPNFLAFNTGGTFENGGTPQGPQTIRFDPAVTVVQINGGVADFLMECYNDDVLVGSDTLPFSSTMATMSVVAAAIDRCVFTWPQSTAVLDDLAFDGDFVGIDADEGLPVPTLGPVGLGILALLMLAVFGLRRRLV